MNTSPKILSSKSNTLYLGFGLIKGLCLGFCLGNFLHISDSKSIFFGSECIRSNHSNLPDLVLSETTKDCV